MQKVLKTKYNIYFLLNVIYCIYRVVGLLKDSLKKKTVQFYAHK